MAYFGNNLCNKGDGKCNDISICWDFTVFKGINFPPKTPAGGAQSTLPGPQLQMYPPATLGCANVHMLATLAFPIGA